MVRFSNFSRLKVTTTAAMVSFPGFMLWFFGMLTASFYSTVAGLYLPGKYSLIHSFDEISFMKPVFIGDELTVNAEVIDKDEALKMIRLQVIIENQENKKVSKAKMKILVTK